MGRRRSVTETAMGAPMKPHLNCCRWILVSERNLGNAVWRKGKGKKKAYPDEEPIHESVQGSTDDEDVE